MEENERPCMKCGNTGKVEWKHNHFGDCPSCDGTGYEQLYSIEQIEEAVYKKYPDDIVVGVFFKSLREYLTTKQNKSEGV